MAERKKPTREHERTNMGSSHEQAEHNGSMSILGPGTQAPTFNLPSTPGSKSRTGGLPRPLSSPGLLPGGLEPGLRRRTGRL